MTADVHGGVVVAQLGARRHYAVPQALHARGLLYRLYTDNYFFESRMRQWVVAAGRQFGVGALSRAAGRHASGLPDATVRAFQLFGMAYRLRASLARTATLRTANWIWGGRRFCEMVAEEVSPDSKVVYAFSSAAKELFERSREIGATSCLDHATAPRRSEMSLVSEEWERFPGWELNREADGCIEDYQRRQSEELSLADRIICASSFARDMVLKEGVDAARIRVVPLGYAPPESRVRSGDKSKSGELRVLFVGGDGLRKGIGYLAHALERLKSRSVVARVAGDLEVSEQAIVRLRQSMKLLGPVPRREARALFEWADVLVLPSVSDTFGLVVLEAMAAGVPVIASRNTCGPDVIREGVDGFVVPIRDPEAIASRLETLAIDRRLLSEMSRNAVIGAAQFSLESYGDRLVAAIPR